jgi:predicted membrane protein
MADSDRNSGRELVGLIIVLIGFGLLINTLNIFPAFPMFTFFSRFWLPTMFIGIGALILSRRGPNDGLFPGMFFVLFGFLFFLNKMDWGFNFSRLIGPAILIWIGLMFLTRNQRHPSTWRYRREQREQRREEQRAHWEDKRAQWENRFDGMATQSTDTSDYIHATAILSGFNRKCPSQQFRGGDVTAIMGGGKIDLREAQIQDSEAVIDIFALMGGIDIQVPKDWIVEARFTPVMGGFADRRTPDKLGTQRLVIHGTAIMGSVTVSN